MVTPTKNTSLLKFPAAPRLPSPTREYSPDMVDQLENSLRLYFNQIDNTLQALLGVRGSQYMNAPYGAFQHNTNQTAASTTAAYPLLVNVVDYSNGVTIDNTGVSPTYSKISVEQSGIYNIQFSTQFINPDSQEHDISIWLAKNGTNVADTASYFTVPSRHGGTDGRLIAALNLFVQLAAGDYVQIMWNTDSTLVYAGYVAAATTPDRPLSPSHIVTVQLVSSVIG